MAREKSRNRANHKPFERGPKTHKADVRQNRGEPEEPRPDYRSEEKGETNRVEKTRDEHPTRMKATGHQPDRRNK